MSAPPRFDNRQSRGGRGGGGRGRRGGGRGGRNGSQFNQPLGPRMSTSRLLQQGDYLTALSGFEEDLRLAVRGALRVDALSGVGMNLPIDPSGPILVGKFQPNDVIDLACDGASRGNPGAASIGGIFTNQSDEAEGDYVYQFSHYLGYQVTNNVAEYSAVICGMKYAAHLGVRRLVVRSDSQLVVNHCTNVWRVREPHLLPFYQAVQDLKSRFQQVDFRYFPREQNQLADLLANEALDKVVKQVAGLAQGILPCAPTDHITMLLATVAETRSLLLAQHVRRQEWQEALGLAPRYGMEIKGAMIAADALYAAEASASLSLSSSSSSSTPHQALAETVSMLWDRHHDSLHEVERHFMRESRKLEGMSGDRNQARASIGEQRWNVNKPLPNQSTFAERRNACIAQVKLLGQLKQEMEQTSSDSN